MSIAYELSSEAAVWLLARRAPIAQGAAQGVAQTQPAPAQSSTPNDMRRIILELHTTLRRLRQQERAARRLPAT